MKRFIALLTLGLVAPLVIAQQQNPQFPTDPKTGRAIGAKEVTPEQVRRLMDKDTKTLIIDVRDADEFEKETIQGAVNIPLPQLAGKLKDLPKDATLVFT